jgi:hypothetical protein
MLFCKLVATRVVKLTGTLTTKLTVLLSSWFASDVVEQVEAAL